MAPPHKKGNTILPWPGLATGDEATLLPNLTADTPLAKEASVRQADRSQQSQFFSSGVSHLVELSNTAVQKVLTEIPGAMLSMTSKHEKP